MTDLLPCPFCGSTNLRYEFAGSQGYICCDDCGTQGPCDEQAADPICDHDAAYAAWNRRPAAAPVAMIELITDMARHLAHMQELLEDYEYGDPEDYHWYRESVRLRAVAAEVLA